MPKADPTKNYYAILEIPPSSSAAEIKKQFHKLALIYHPDRNPGKEAEYNPRFQIIQEAHEILSDEAERARYDARRRVMSTSSTYNPTAGFRRPAAPPRSNPYQATSNFPPPPSRTRPRTEVPPPTAKTGADRYSHWASSNPPPTPPRQERPSSTADANHRANVFTAWQAMNSNQKRQAQQDGTHRYNVPPAYAAPNQQRPVPPPPTQFANSSSPPRSEPRDPHFPPGVRRADSMRVPPRRGGFDPNSPTPGMDEGPAPGSSNYRSGKSGQNTSATSPSTPMGPPPRRPHVLDEHRSQSSEHVPFAEGIPKEKRPYAVNADGLEKGGFHKSASFADTRNYFSFDAGKSRRNRSTASPPRPHVEIHSAEEESSSVSDESDDSRTDLPKAHPPGSSHAPDSKSVPPRDGRHLRFDLPHLKDPMARSSNPELRSPSTERPEVDLSSKSDDEMPQPTRSKSNPNMFSFVGSNSDGDTPPVQAPRSAGDEPSTHSSTTFEADRWQNTDWAREVQQGAGQTGGQSSPPRKTKTPGLRPAARRNASESKPVTPQPASVEEEEMGDPALFTGFPEDESDGLDAMDVDSEPPANVRRPTVTVEDTSSSSKSPRGVFLEPLRPEWRDSGILNGQYGGQRRSSVPHVPHGPQAEQVPPPSSARPPPPSHAASNNFDMNSLRNVAPFQPTKQGFQGMKDDLEAELPFESKPSPSGPNIPSYRNPAFVNMPEIPKAPIAPMKFGGLTRSEYESYLAEFGRYLQTYHKFYINMSARFSAGATDLASFTLPNSPSPNNPQTQHFARGHGMTSASGIMPFWLSAPGETDNLKGWQTYKKYIEAEAKMRKYMNIASEKHMAAVEAHDLLRLKVERMPPQE